MTGRWWRAKWQTPDGGPCYSELWAHDRAHAEELAQWLGFSDVTPISRPVIEYRASRLAELEGGLSRADVLHSLCYLSTLAARAGTAKAEDLVGDGSPIHELAHYLGAGPNIRGGKMREYLMERIRWLESIVPGLPPDDLVLTTERSPKGEERF